MLATMPAAIATTITTSAIPQLLLNEIDVESWLTIGVSANSSTNRAATASDVATSPTASIIKLRRSLNVDAPKTLYVFIAFMRTGMSAKKKFTKFIIAIRIISTAIAMKVYVVNLLPTS